MRGPDAIKHTPEVDSDLGTILQIPKPAMSLVPVLLRTIARVVGCSVDCFQMSVRRKEWLGLDVWDEEFDGTISRATLTPALLEALSAAMGEAVLDGGACTSEGGTLTVQITWEQDHDIVLRVAVMSAPTHLNACGIGFTALDAATFPGARKTAPGLFLSAWPWAETLAKAHLTGRRCGRVGVRPTSFLRGGLDV